MDHDLQPSSSDGQLPTIGEYLANLLGFQIPSIPMPQTIRNLDKAASVIVLAAGENAAARIEASTAQVVATGKINVDGLHRTAEEERKFKNRLDALQITVGELNQQLADDDARDAPEEIDVDWLNTFSRLAEDKSSQELKGLFGRILAGEIRAPGAFSLRTLQFISTLSRSDAHQASEFLSFAFNDFFVPLSNKLPSGPSLDARLLMEEIGLASQVSMLDAIVWNKDIPPGSHYILRSAGSGILIDNMSDREVRIEIKCQKLSQRGRELVGIANPPPVSFEYIKAVAQLVFEKLSSAGFAKELKAGDVTVQAGPIKFDGPDALMFDDAYTASASWTNPNRQPPA
jgi:hypothetical protein